MTDLTQLTIAEARIKLRAREITAGELTEAYLQAIDAANPALNAYIAVTDERARAMAKASDERLANRQGGALEGIPLGIKDLFATEGVHTQACSHILDRFEPRYESTVTANLWADGAVMLGKLNMDEFAMGSSNETSYYGPVINPWRRSRASTVVRPASHMGEGGFVSDGGVRTDRVLDNAQLVPGGSSGGSAAAVSACLCGRRDGHRYRRLDPAAGGLHRHRGHQADLWPLLALGHRRLRLVARPGGADRPRRPRCRRSCSNRWPRSTPRTRRRSTGRFPTTRRRSASRCAACASASRASTGSRECPTRSRRFGRRASPG